MTNFRKTNRHQLRDQSKPKQKTETKIEKKNKKTSQLKSLEAKKKKK